MPRENEFRSRALQFLYDRYVGERPAQRAAFAKELFNADIARTIHRLRTRAGLTQRELADRVGTSASAICRLEDADYRGHSLTMLQRIAAALEQRLEIRFVPAKRVRRPA